MTPIRIGFIGLSTKGWASDALVGPLFDPLLSSLYTLTALCTTSEATATEAARKYSELAGRAVKAYYGEEGLHAIANDPEVDLVAVSVKIPDHYRAVMPAIEAGKDIFVEWTVGNGYQETVRIAQAAKRKGVRVLVGAQANQNPSLKKLKELVASEKIGRILSTTAVLLLPEEAGFIGKTTNSRGAYAPNINSGATLLTIPVGHFLSVLTDILGDIADVTASGAVQYGTTMHVDKDGQPTGVILVKTTHDQIALSGVLRSEDRMPGTFFNIHCRAGLPIAGENGRGRTVLKWIIDGELGSIEVQNKPEDGLLGSFMAVGDKRIFLNGEEVTWEVNEADRLGNTGRAWLEFAKGEEGNYWGIDDSVKLHRVLEAAQTSINEGKRIIL